MLGGHKNEREANPTRSHSIEGWLKEAVKQYELKRTADSSPASPRGPSELHPPVDEVGDGPDDKHDPAPEPGGVDFAPASADGAVGVAGDALGGRDPEDAGLA